MPLVFSHVMSPVQEMFTCKLSFCTLQTETLCSNRSLIHPTVIKLSSEADLSMITGMMHQITLMEDMRERQLGM